MNYLIDTDISIYLINEKPPHVIERFKHHSIQEIGISSVTIYELTNGVLKSQRKKQNQNKLELFLTPFEFLDFSADDARVTGKIRADLEKKGQIIGPYDLMIAGQALNRDLTLVTNNTREFKRIVGLKVENWAE